MAILRSVASAAAHLHARGIAHGDLYAHNILINEAGHALLGDFGAATIYRKSHTNGEAIERLEVLAFGHLIEDLLGLVDHGTVDEEGEFLDLLDTLHRWCTNIAVLERPSFVDVHKILEGFRGF